MLNTPIEINLTEEGTLTIPFFSTTIPAGSPSSATDYIESKIDLNDLLIKHPTASFMIKVVGDSMLNSFIPPKALLIVDRSLTAISGSIIVAMLNGDFTVKKLVKNKNEIYLMPSNPKYFPIKVTEDMNFEVWGVVAKIIIDPKDVGSFWIG